MLSKKTKFRNEWAKEIIAKMRSELHFGKAVEIKAVILFLSIHTGCSMYDS